MFTLEEIKAAHAKVKTGADFPKYIQDLIKLGVEYYNAFVITGYTDYYSTDGQKVTNPPKYKELTIADKSDAEQFRADLKAHQNGKTDYLTFCKDCAKSGIEGWTVSLPKMTCTYFDKSGNKILVEQIPG